MTSTTTATTDGTGTSDTATSDTATEPPGPRLRLISYEPEPGEPPLPAPPPPVAALVPPTRETDDTERAARPVTTRVVRLALEVLDGRRPPAQLAAHVEPSALRYWRAAVPASRPAGSSRLLRLVLSAPAPGVAEVAAVCRIGNRVRALAARFERTGAGAGTGGWRCTVLRLG